MLSLHAQVDGFTIHSSLLKQQCKESCDEY